MDPCQRISLFAVAVLACLVDCAPVDRPPELSASGSHFSTAADSNATASEGQTSASSANVGLALNSSLDLSSQQPLHLLSTDNPPPGVRSGFEINSMMGFLRKFGYLEEGLPNSAALYQESAIQNAISTMQRFGGLNPTGRIDNNTLQLLVTPRCGNKDVDPDQSSKRRKRYIIGSQGWNKRRLTYYLANWSPKLGSEDLTLRELDKAFKIWADYAHLQFVNVPTPDADIIVLFGSGYHADNYPFDGPGYTLAHAYYPHEFGHFGGDVHFDEDEPWTIGVNGSSDVSAGVDFFTVAVHELGHSLGLSHSPVSGSIMFPYYKGSQPNLQLDYDDILAMYQLYISRPVHDDRQPESATVASTTTTSTESAAGPAPEGTEATPTVTSTTPTPTTSRTTTPYYDYEDYGDRHDEDDERPDSGIPDSGKTDAGDPDGGSSGTGGVDSGNSGTVVPGSGSADAGSADETEKKRKDGNSVTVSYHGDYETVDDHLRRVKGSSTTPTPSAGIPTVAGSSETNTPSGAGDHGTSGSESYPSGSDPATSPSRGGNSGIPDICQGKFDAVSVLRNELFVFKDQYVWRLSQRGHVEPGYPTHFRSLFRELPHHLKKIDAVYERPDGLIVFFSGAHFWVSDGDRIVESAVPLTHLGLPDGLEQLNAAMVWPKNQKTYLFSKDLYWRYDDKKKRMDPGYPHDMARWRGVPSNLDAAMHWTDGRTYFFKNTLYWRFDDTIVKAESRYPQSAPTFWLGCADPDERREEPYQAPYYSTYSYTYWFYK